MLRERDLTYHLERAEAEFDRARSSAHAAAAAAHRRLAALHLDRLRAEDELCGGAAAARR